MEQKAAKNRKLFLIMLVYLAGIFMGAIDTGIVTPARTIIQNNLMVGDKTGIWMITIYTLAYAASIPVMGKLADRHGRKLMYIISISLFGLGSLLCGLSRYSGSFEMLLISRAIQAIGGGGIMPVATAEFGTSFPPEKRGMALGLVGGVYGIANIFGSLAGSAILSIFGTQNWQFIFFVNIPITLFIIVAGLFVLPNTRDKTAKKIDGLGTLLVVVMVLCLLYGLKQVDFFAFTETITSVGAYPFLIAFILLLPIFLLVEKRAEDPVINLSYFTNGKILTTLAVAFTSGFVMMGIVFIPQFCENSLMIPSGDGGYFTVVLGLLSGVSAMLSGKLIDKIGARLVLILGFSITIFGALFLTLVAVPHPGLPTVIISLMVLGFGLGFTIGAPVNYMMLENTRASESSSALATLSLIRSIGTAIAPAIMVGFIVHSGASLQTNVMNIMPTEISLPAMPYVQEISDQMEALKRDPNMAERLAEVEIPDLSAMQTIKIDLTGSGGYEMPADTLIAFQTSDVTTITAVTKQAAESMFSQMMPSVIENIQIGLASGTEGIAAGISAIDTQIVKMQETIEAMSIMPGGAPQAASLQSAVTQMNASKESMETLCSEMNALREAIPGAFETAKNNYLAEIDARSGDLETTYQSTLNAGYKSIYLTALICSLLAILLLVFYGKRKESKSDINPE